MNRRDYCEMAWRAPLAAAALAVLALGTAGTGRPQLQAQGAAKAAAPAAKAQAAPKEPAAAANGLSTGIKVHGHWVIDVKNPDGTIAQHREFENSLSDYFTLTDLLSGQAVAGGWDIGVFDLANSPLCGGGLCRIYQSGITYNVGGTTNTPFNCTPSAGVSCNLTLLYGNAPNSGTTAFVLSGSVIAVGGGNITGVNTQLFSCVGGLSSQGTATSITVSPAQCATDSGQTPQIGDTTFTVTTLANPINNVQAGQTIAVVVYISFQ